MSRTSMLALSAMAVVALAVVVLRRGGTPDEAPASGGERSAATAGLPPEVAPAPPGAGDLAQGAPEPGLPAADAAGGDSLLLRGEGPDDTAWAKVDLDAVRAAMPDNVYWRLAAPTKDPEVLRERQEERDRWNVEYGKVLSNTATEDEVYAFYAYQQRVSEDYLAFSVHLLKNYGKYLDERDIGLLKLATELHLARLEEIPRRTAEALERRLQHEATRQAWLADQKAFAGGDDGR